MGSHRRMLDSGPSVIQLILLVALVFVVLAAVAFCCYAGIWVAP